MAPISQDLEPPATAGRFKALSPEVMLSAQTFLWFGGRREEGSVGPREDGSRSNDYGSIQKATGLDDAAARASQAQSSGKQVATERQSSSLRARHSIRDQEGLAGRLALLGSKRVPGLPDSHFPYLQYRSG